MHLVKRLLMVTAGVAVGLVILNLTTRSFMPSIRGYLGLSA